MRHFPKFGKKRSALDTPRRAENRCRARRQGAVNFEYVLLCGLCALSVAAVLLIFAEDFVGPAFGRSALRLRCWVLGNAACGESAADPSALALRAGNTLGAGPWVAPSVIADPSLPSRVPDPEQPFATPAGAF